MKCSECYWCTLNSPTGSDVVCCNRASENYNKVFSEKVSQETECEDAESERAVDYRELTPWQFASKYYG